MALFFLMKGNQTGFFIMAILSKNLFYPQIRIGLLRKTEEFFSPSQASQTIPVIDSALTIGVIASSALLIGLFKFFETSSVLFVWFIPLVLLVVLLTHESNIIGHIPNLIPEIVQVPRRKYAHAFQKIRSVPFLKLLILVLVFQSSLMAVTEFEFMKELSSNFSEIEEQELIPFDSLQASLFDHIKDFGVQTVEKVEHFTSNVVAHHTLAHDLGILSLIFGCIALFVELFLVSRLLERFGVIRTMALYFGGFFLIAISWFFGFLSMNFVRGYGHGTHAVFASGYHISFYSTFSRERELLRHILEGFFVPLGVFLGVGMVFAFQYFHLPMGYLLGGLALFLTGISLFIPRWYTHLSTQNLKFSEHISEKLHAIEVLGQTGHKGSATILSEALVSLKSHPVVREKIIATITKIQDPSVIHTYTEILSNPVEDEEIKMRILDSVLQMKTLQKYWNAHAFSQNHFLETLKKLYAEITHPHFKKLTVMNLFRQLPSVEIGQFFKKMMEDPDEKIQSICLRSCRVFEDPEIALYIRPYLTHESPRIQGHALIALWKFDTTGDLKSVLEQLLLSAEKDRVIAGIYAAGEIGESIYGKELWDIFEMTEDRYIKTHALIALAKMKEEKPIPDLLEILFGDDTDLSQRTFYMLKRAPVDIRDQIHKEIQYRVSRKVSEILVPHKIYKRSHLANLSQEIKESLKQLYRLAERYDDILILEQI
jgi:HEAT repeat protein